MPTATTPNSQSSEMTGMSNPMGNSIFSDTQSIAEQSEPVQGKSTRSTAKQRKSDLDDYRKAFFSPIKLGKDNKHQVAISNDTFDRVERIARYFGNADYSVSSFVEHIINEHLDANVVNYESWFSVISKSF
ncbi:MAG: DUF3408 domain-containing protein [Muribaculaceae bacterium]|nr:DUF3408 domain-containing protein [Muribaculaceae bacterium]